MDVEQKPPETRKRAKATADAPAPGFDAFWEAYPRKDAKIRAAHKWNSLAPDADLQAVLLDALEKHKRSRQWLREDGEFIPLPATWLNGRYWENRGVKVSATAPDADPDAETRKLREAAARRKASSSPPPGKGATS